MSRKQPPQDSPLLPTSWETRYSSSEMMYLEVSGGGLRAHLNQNTGDADFWTLDDVSNGAADPMVRSIFGESVLAEVHAAVAARKQGR